MTNEDKITIRGRLLEAELAYHRLMVGESAREFVDQNGEKVSYTSASAVRLEAYIRDLKALLDPKPNANAPIGFTY